MVGVCEGFYVGVEMLVAELLELGVFREADRVGSDGPGVGD